MHARTELYYYAEYANDISPTWYNAVSFKKYMGSGLCLYAGLSSVSLHITFYFGFQFLAIEHYNHIGILGPDSQKILG